MDFKEQATEVITSMAKALVDNPDNIKLDIKQGEQTTVFELTVSKEDLGKIIGKQGRNAKAMRQIVTATAAKHRVRAVMEIME